MNKQETIDDFELDDEQRVANILSPGKKIEDLPDVSFETLEKYYQFLSQKLPSDLLLTGALLNKSFIKNSLTSYPRNIIS